MCCLPGGAEERKLRKYLNGLLAGFFSSPSHACFVFLPSSLPLTPLCLPLPHSSAKTMDRKRPLINCEVLPSELHGETEMFVTAAWC